MLQFAERKSGMYYVYVHTFPNGKVYVGEAKNPIDRWANGEGYWHNQEITDAIKEYGWHNIKHEVVAEFVDEKDALVCEAVLMFYLDSENNDKGYNKTHIKEKVLNAYAEKIDASKYAFDRPKRSKNVLEENGVPVSVGTKMIDEWIYNKKHREIAKDRLIDGMSTQETEKKHNISERQIINIMIGCNSILKEHINK